MNSSAAMVTPLFSHHISDIFKANSHRVKAEAIAKIFVDFCLLLSDLFACSLIIFAFVPTFNWCE